jgi:hypothetical protein
MEIVVRIEPADNVMRAERIGLNVTGRKDIRNCDCGFHRVLVPTASQEL